MTRFFLFIGLVSISAQAQTPGAHAGGAPSNKANPPHAIATPKVSPLFPGDQPESFEIRHIDNAIVTYNLFDGKNPDGSEADKETKEKHKEIARKIVSGAKDKEQNAQIKAQMPGTQDYLHIKILAIELRPVASDPEHHPEIKDQLEVWAVSDTGKMQMRSIKNKQATPIRISKQDFLDGKRQVLKATAETVVPGNIYNEVLELESALEFELGPGGVNLKDVTVGTSMVGKGVSAWTGQVLKQYPSSMTYPWLSGTRSPRRDLPDSQMSVN
ncbi:hypothetical protein K2X33_02440 [bacterium]|nr:hypothetical protein [bacterium]